MLTSKKSSEKLQAGLIIAAVTVMLCALTVRIFVAVYTDRLGAMPVLESEVIHDAPAQALARGENPGRVLLTHYPGFTFFLTAVFNLLGVDYSIVRLILFSVTALTCIVIYFLARVLTTPATGLAAGLCYALLPQLVLHSLYIFPGQIFSLLITLVVGYSSMFQQRYDWKYGVILGFVLACSAYFEPWIMLYPLVYGGLYMLLYRKNSFINCFKLLVIPLTVMLILVAPWLLILFTYDATSLLARSDGLLFDLTGWMGFIPPARLKIPFLFTWIIFYIFTLVGLLLSHRNKLFMPLHAFMLVSLIVTVIPGSTVTYQPAIYAVSSIYAGAGFVVCLAKFFKIMRISVPWLSDMSWRYR